MRSQQAIMVIAMALGVTQAYAHDETNAQCNGYRVSGTERIIVDIQTESIAIPGSARRITDYVATLGPDDSQSKVCFDADSSLVFTLSDSGRYAFRDIAFEYPFGFEPAGSPFKQWAVHSQSIIVHLVPTPGSTGYTFKYTIPVEDLNTGTMVAIDPQVGNDPQT